MSSAFDRPGGAPEVPDTPDEVGAPERRTQERSDTWLNIDNESDEQLLSFLGLDRDDRVEPDVADFSPQHAPLERADKPHEVTQPQADAGYYPNIPRTTPERLNAVPVFDGPPRREQVAQGEVGDCGVLSTIGGVAGHRPDTIKNLIKQTGDGKYEITLHDVTSATASDPVARPTGDTTTYRVNDEVPVGTGDRKPIGVKPDSCAWPALIEKVVAAEDQTWDAKQTSDWDNAWRTWHKHSVDAERRDSGLPPALSDAPTGYNRIDIGSTAYQRADLLARLTGEAAEVRGMPGEQQGEQALLDAFRDQLTAGKPVLVGTRLERTQGELYPFNVESGHAYEVAKIEGDKVHLHNPWGPQFNPAPMDVTTFWEYFRGYNHDGSRNGLYTTLM